jgi:hypothetical protein
MKTKKTGRGEGRKIEREQGKEEKRKKRISHPRTIRSAALGGGLILTTHPCLFYDTTLLIFTTHFRKENVSEKHMFLSQAPSGGEQVPGPFLILAQGKRPQHNLCFLPIGNVLATSLSGEEKAERARERIEEIKKKGKGNEMFPFYPPFAL